MAKQLTTVQIYRYGCESGLVWQNPRLLGIFYQYAITCKLAGFHASLVFRYEVSETTSTHMLGMVNL